MFTPEEWERDLKTAAEQGRSEYERWVTSPVYDRAGNLRGSRVLREDMVRRNGGREQERIAQLEKDLLQSQILVQDQALDRTKEELRALTASLFGTQEEKRGRVSRELHEDL